MLCAQTFVHFLSEKFVTLRIEVGTLCANKNSIISKGKRINGMSEVNIKYNTGILSCDKRLQLDMEHSMILFSNNFTIFF